MSKEQVGGGREDHDVGAMSANFVDEKDQVLDVGCDDADIARVFVADRGEQILEDQLAVNRGAR